MIQNNGEYVEGITWEELQSLKDQSGYGNCCAVEIYPPNKDIVNVANMRHLWIPVEDPKYRWGKK